MSKNIVIQKNGVAQNLNNVAKLVTGSIEAGTQTWIPEDEANDYAQTSALYVTRNGEYEAEPGTAGYSEVEVAVNPTLTTKYIVANGEYNAEDDSADGYSSVTVDVDPEGTVGSKFISENGTYPASADHLDGFDEVYVSVDTISGENYEIEDDEDGVYVEYDDIDYSVDPGNGISYILTTDPEDGNQQLVSVESDGTVTKSPYPSGIQIVTPPTKTSYTEGETMDYTGIVVKLVNADGTTYTDARYPNGIIPMGELEFPVSVAPEGGGGESQTEATIDDPSSFTLGNVQLPFQISTSGGTWSWTPERQHNGTTEILEFPSGVCVTAFRETSGNTPTVVLVAASERNFSITEKYISGSTTETTIPASLTELFGKQFYVANITTWTYAPQVEYLSGFFNDVSSIQTAASGLSAYTDPVDVAYIMLYGTRITVGGSAEIPVRWRSWAATFNPITGQYEITDKRLTFSHAHETSFEIEVTSA